MINDLLNLTTNIVSQYVTNNQVSLPDLPTLIRTTYQALGSIDTSLKTEVVESTPDEPFVHAKKSVFPDHLVCMCCGKQQKMLKRHLKTAHDMTTDEYRIKWGLPASYPMVAPEYSEKRSDLAKEFGLGLQRKAR